MIRVLLGAALVVALVFVGAPALPAGLIRAAEDCLRRLGAHAEEVLLMTGAVLVVVRWVFNPKPGCHWTCGVTVAGLALIAGGTVGLTFGAPGALVLVLAGVNLLLVGDCARVFAEHGPLWRALRRQWVAARRWAGRRRVVLAGAALLATAAAALAR